MNNKFRTDCVIFHNNDNMYRNFKVRRRHFRYNRRFIANLNASMENVMQK